MTGRWCTAALCQIVRSTDARALVQKMAANPRWMDFRFCGDSQIVLHCFDKVFYLR
eukprot:CAMPEP_0204306840 /NCGR_PEP_ID=MMETSP0468-20130131/85629_1 /ASSEMBLY_ACC=CAM_ASM_000383 /TAXON_ID=2969 /ORGANISM="Oxyrrhis marina" /LENGTH=55 /DNA_ID=CAMNT_0051286195 /DNA_START=818 /DNA_END=985 /DNA_ORIENTATION=+